MSGMETPNIHHCKYFHTHKAMRHAVKMLLTPKYRDNTQWLLIICFLSVTSQMFKVCGKSWSGLPVFRYSEKGGTEG